jgi:hypothetical protein
MEPDMRGVTDSIQTYVLFMKYFAVVTADVQTWRCCENLGFHIVIEALGILRA